MEFDLGGEDSLGGCCSNGWVIGVLVSFIVFHLGVPPIYDIFVM